MSIPLEHDYIGFTESVPSLESSEMSNAGLNLKATELRLGLPGSESPLRDDGLEDINNGLFSHKSSTSVSGAKRGFSVAIDRASAKWVAGSEPDSTKNGGLFSPRGGVNDNKTQPPASAVSAGKDGVSPSVKPLLEEKPQLSPPAAKAQVVGWPPIRSFRKNSMTTTQPPKNTDDADGKSGSGCLYVKVSMDGAPYLRKVDLKTYGSYVDLSSALEKMFSSFTIGHCGSNGVPNRDALNESRLMDLLHGSEYVLTYEDKDGDWMLVGDVPWEMFTESCTRMRIMKSSEAIGLAPRAMEKCKNRN